jgi:hypothetical protein
MLPMGKKKASVIVRKNRIISIGPFLEVHVRPP